MAIARYLSHAQVEMDPDVPVPQWGLNTIGQARIALLAASNALAGTQVIYSSTETKAVETAAPLAKALSCPHHKVPEMGENDRSATGFLPGPAFEAAADAFFAHPDDSYQGWETARDAQKRIVAAVHAALANHPDQDILFVGHGAVGTLLYCALMDAAIDRRHDQPDGGGNIYSFDTDTRRPDGPWQPLETLLA
ncbi:MAG: histidine phosphatase family protein [Pseudomonadota bacterium]